MADSKPLFLAAGARQGNGKGYVSDPRLAMKGEPECVGPAILDSYAESARFYESLRHRALVAEQQRVRPLLKAEDRIRDLEARAKRNHIDLRSEFRLMRQMLERDRKGGRQPSQKVILRIEKAEGLLDGVKLQ